MLVKVCGLKDPDQVSIISKKVDFVGFIFYTKSKRYTDRSATSFGAKKTGVFVDEKCETIMKMARLEKLDVIQLHGKETPEECAAISDQLQVIKAFGVDERFDFSELSSYENYVDYFLFDTKTPLKGGSGIQFDWSILENYKGETPFLLSGGISLNSLEQIKAFKHDKFVGIDLNSRFETEPGTKDIELLNTFLHDLNN